jgi:hypothetical protein
LNDFKKTFVIILTSKTVITALAFGTPSICNTDYLEIYDAFLYTSPTASRRMITRYCGNVRIKFQTLVAKMVLNPQICTAIFGKQQLPVKKSITSFSSKVMHYKTNYY